MYFDHKNTDHVILSDLCIFFMECILYEHSINKLNNIMYISYNNNYVMLMCINYAKHYFQYYTTSINRIITSFTFVLFIIIILFHIDQLN